MINYTEKIPNNVDLGRDRVLQRALEHWQPAYMGWWYDMGPNESHNYEVYLRTAISVEPDGSAQVGDLEMLTTRESLARSTRRRRIGWRFTCLPSSPTAMANFTSVPWRNPASTRWREPAASCSPRKHTICLSARQA